MLQIFRYYPQFSSVLLLNSTCWLIKLIYCLLHLAVQLRHLIVANSVILNSMIKIFRVNFDLSIVIRLIELLSRNLGILGHFSRSIKLMIRTGSSFWVKLIVNLLFFLNFLLSPLYNLFDVLVLNFHLPFLVLFIKVSVNFLDFHHLLEDEIAVLGRFELSWLTWLITGLLGCISLRSHSSP